MKRILLFVVLLLSTMLTFAQNEPPIRVGVDNFYPPFTMRAGNNQVFGFDIALVTRICQLLNRTCKFYPMLFSDLLAELEDGGMDIAVGAIAITPERAKHMSFSKPYLKSQARFLGNKSVDPKAFNIKALGNYKIGVVRGTFFPQVLTSLGVSNSQITSYNRLDSVIDALNEGFVDIAIMDNTSALYWQQEASGILVSLGQAFDYGYGIAIAVNRNKRNLLQSINNALDTYLKEADFKKNYDKYLSYFNNP